MPTFDDLEDAEGVIQEAWDSFKDHGSVWSSINDDAVQITWRFRSGTMDAGIEQHYVFTGDVDALTAWWESFGAGYDVLPKKWKPAAQAFQINLTYTAEGETWFNFHLSVPEA